MKQIILLLLFIGLNLCNAQKSKLNVYVFVAEECPISINMTPALNQISARFINEANFNLVFPLENSTIASSEKFKNKYHLDNFKVILDKKQKLTKLLHAEVTPEAIITNENGKILYKGRINDSYLDVGKRRHIYSNNDLLDALKLLEGGNDVPKPWKNAVGCLITLND